MHTNEKPQAGRKLRSSVHFVVESLFTKRSRRYRQTHSLGDKFNEPNLESNSGRKAGNASTSVARRIRVSIFVGVKVGMDHGTSG
jgi:hypothetical protein